MPKSAGERKPKPGKLGPCGWPEGCQDQGKLYRYKNALGHVVEHHLCRKHVGVLRNPEQREEIFRRIGQTLGAVNSAAAAISPDGRNVSPTELAEHDVFKALRDHNERCEMCRKCDEWISQESLAGRIKGHEDTRRVGEYVNAHACRLGIYLRERAGSLMAGLST